MNMRAAARPDDLDRALELLRVQEEDLTGRRSRLGPSGLRQWLTRIDLEDATWLFERTCSAPA
jgi:hypothetical protein